MSRNYKNISVNFNLDNDKDRELFEWLSEKRAKTAFIKDVLEEYMNGNNVIKVSAPVDELTVDDIDIEI